MSSRTSCVIARAIGLAALCVWGLGCAPISHKTVYESTAATVDQNYVRPDPGVVEYVYEPPMIDVIDIPPGLDPEGMYYQPSHQEVIEIRQGHWQYYKNPQQ